MRPEVTDVGSKSVKVHGGPGSLDNQVNRTRFIYNFNVSPGTIDALFVKKKSFCQTKRLVC